MLELILFFTGWCLTILTIYIVIGQILWLRDQFINLGNAQDLQFKEEIEYLEGSFSFLSHKYGLSASFIVAILWFKSMVQRSAEIKQIEYKD